MKGFPNQVAKLPKLAIGMQELVRLVDTGANARDDGVLGEALVRAGVAGPGRGKNRVSVGEYLRRQREKKPSYRSFEMTARGLRELFKLLGLIVDTGTQVEPTTLGRQAAAFANVPMNSRQISFWRKAIGNISHDGGDGETSHPYQLLLRLVSRKPGILRAKCALALEAKNDSADELKRIVRLAELSEAEIRDRIGVTKRIWDNKKKVLPSFAEQLNDVVKTRGGFWLADAPGRNAAGRSEAGKRALGGKGGGVRAPRTSRKVTPDTIARAGSVDDFDEIEISPNIDPAVAGRAIKQRLDRWRRHQAIVQNLAARLAAAGATLNENPFDILALIEAVGLLVEVKTLSGSAADERERVRDAVGQLLYYEAFVTKPVVGEGAVHKVACFESPISQPHKVWLNQLEIAALWKTKDGFTGDALAADILGDYIEELR